MGVAAVAPGVEPSSHDLVDAFRHEALFYSGQTEFVARTSAFVRDGLDRDEPVLALVVAAKIELLRAELGCEADRVFWADMAGVGRNPGRIISVWREFVGDHAGRGGRVRGIGEPVWSERTLEELVEAQRHESLINLAFAGTPAWVLCPYDLATLERSVIDEAHRSHPLVTIDGLHGISHTYSGLEEIRLPFGDPLIEPAGRYEEMKVTIGRLSEMRKLIAERAGRSGLAQGRVSDLVLAVNEVATNSLRHGRGCASLRLWARPDGLICEVADEGAIDEPLAGRLRPSLGEDSGYGLWMANQLCDLVELRSFPGRSVVRLRMNLR